MTERTTYMTLAGLRKRGWTDAMVRDLLGEPDVQGRDPRRRSIAPVRLYQLARVEAVERTPEFSQGYGGSGRVAAERRRLAVLEAIRAEPIRVPRLPRAELERRAVLHRRVLGDARAPVTAEALVRWQVGYLLYALSRYDALLDGLFGSTGRAEAERLLRRRLCEAIAQAYPALEEECHRRAGTGGAS